MNFENLSVGFHVFIISFILAKFQKVQKSIAISTAVHGVVQIGFVPNLQSSCKSARFPSGGDQFLVKLKPAKNHQKTVRSC